MSKIWHSHPNPLHTMLIVPPYNINFEILNNLQSSKEESITFCIMYYKGQGSWLIHFKRVFNNTFWNQSIFCLSQLNWTIVYHNIPFHKYLRKWRFAMWFTFTEFWKASEGEGRSVVACVKQTGLNPISVMIQPIVTAQQEKKV